MNFQDKVLRLVSKVPEGKVATYGQIARALGKPMAYRAVGSVLANNPRPVEVPCHRVVRSDGRVGGYVGGRKKKEKLLGEEGVEVEDGRVNLERYQFRDLNSI